MEIFGEIFFKCLVIARVSHFMFGFEYEKQAQMCVFTGRFKVCVCTGCCIRVCAQVLSPGIMLSGFVGFLFDEIPDLLFSKASVPNLVGFRTNILL